MQHSYQWQPAATLATKFQSAQHSDSSTATAPATTCSKTLQQRPSGTMQRQPPATPATKLQRPKQQSDSSLAKAPCTSTLQRHQHPCSGTLQRHQRPSFTIDSFLDSETPVDTCVIHLYMHDMATANDNMLKSKFQRNAKHATVSTAMYMECGYGQIYSPRLNRRPMACGGQIFHKYATGSKGVRCPFPICPP